MSKEYKYPLRLYGIVHSYITEEDREYSFEEFAEVVVSFCALVEKVLKLKLYRKNPVLVFDLSKFKEEDPLIAVVNKKENTLHTLCFMDLSIRFGKVYKRVFSDTEIEIMRDIYRVRNELVHSYKTDEQLQIDKEDITKKMGSLWVKLTKQSIQIFGKDEIKTGLPKKLYTESELRKVLEDEVREKIKSLEMSAEAYVMWPSVATSSWSVSTISCPRCNSTGFSKKVDSGFSQDIMSTNVFTLHSKYSTSDLYKCSNCNLELTEKEYEIAKSLINPGGIQSG